jgi:hypothetical protein
VAHRDLLGAGLDALAVTREIVVLPSAAKPLLLPPLTRVERPCQSQEM